MIEAGEVGAVFTIKDEASAALDRIAAAFDKVQAVIDKFEAVFNRLGENGGGLAKVQEQLKSTGRIGTEATRSISDGFSKVNRRLTSANQKLEALKAGFAEAAVEAGHLEAAMPGLGGGGYRRGGASGDEEGHGRSGPGGHGSGHFGHLAEHVLSGNTRGMFGAAGAVLSGATDAAFSPAGLAAGFAAYEVFDKTAQLADVRALLANQGVSGPSIEAAQAQAFGISEKYGIPAASMMKMMSEISPALNRTGTPDGGLATAQKHIEKLAQAAAVFRSIDEKTGSNVAEDAFDLVKTTEFRNAVGETQFDNAINAMVQGSLASGGKVGPRQWFQAVKYARAAGMNVSDDFLYRMGPELITEFNASGAGTVMSSLYQGIVAGKLSKSALAEMDAIGAFNSNPDAVVRGKDGQVERVHPGAMGDIGETYKLNPDRGMAMLMDRLDQKLQLDAGGKLTPEQLHGQEADWISYVFGNRNAAQLAQTLAFQGAHADGGRLERGAAAAANALELDSAFKNVANTPNFALSQFGASMSNLATQIVGAGEFTTALQNLATGANEAAAVLKFLGTFKLGDDPLSKLMQGSDNLGKAIHNSLTGAVAKEPDPGAAARRALYAKLNGPGYFEHDVGNIKAQDLAGIGAPSHAGPPPAPPIVNVTSPITAPVTGEIHATIGSPTVIIEGFGSLVGRIASEVAGKIAGTLKGATNSAAAPDGRAAPLPPDSSAFNFN